MDKGVFLNQIYDELFSCYGRQGWWPVTRKGMYPAYDGGPVNDRQAFEVIIGAILTQNTSWKNVEKAIVNLNRKKLIDPEKLIKLNKEKLAELIRPSGYYNQKAEKLKTAARFFSENKICSFRKKSTDEMRRQLLGLNGVGNETADSILLYAFNKPIFIIDAYTKRIFSRLGFCSEDAAYHELQELLMSALPEDSRLFNEYHALLVEHAKRHCRKKPECSDCVLKKMCNYGRGLP